jgi:hypothetical protein
MNGAPEVGAYKSARGGILLAWSVFQEADDTRFDNNFIDRLKSIDQRLEGLTPET